MTSSAPRLCVICGARVTNLNPKAVTCDQTCTIARDANITRARAMKMLAAGGNETGPPKIHPSFTAGDDLNGLIDELILQNQ